MCHILNRVIHRFSNNHSIHLKNHTGWIFLPKYIWTTFTSFPFLLLFRIRVHQRKKLCVWDLKGKCNHYSRRSWWPDTLKGNCRIAQYVSPHPVFSALSLLPNCWPWCPTAAPSSPWDACIGTHRSRISREALGPTDLPRSFHFLFHNFAT